MKIKELYSAYRNDHDGQEPTPDEFKAITDHELNAKPWELQKTIVSFLKELKESAENNSQVQPRSGRPYSSSSIDSYHAMLVHLEAFEQTRKRKLDFIDITVGFHADYIEFLMKQYKYQTQYHWEGSAGFQNGHE